MALHDPQRALVRTLVLRSNPPEKIPASLQEQSKTMVPGYTKAASGESPETQNLARPQERLPVTIEVWGKEADQIRQDLAELRAIVVSLNINADNILTTDVLVASTTKILMKEGWRLTQNIINSIGGVD